jgi:hypothetical protein
MIQLLTLSLVLAATGENEAHRPYQVRIVLRMSDNRLLTPLFRDRVQRGLQDGLQAALGPLGSAEVVTRESMLASIRERGEKNERRASLEQTLQLLNSVDDKGLRAALDEYKQLSSLKMHFVLVSMVDDRYEIQARQFDGMTGLASPVVRRELISDRDLVVRTASVLIGLDFGAIGTIAPSLSGSDVTVSLQAGKLGSLLSWVRKGDVFAIAQIRKLHDESLRSVRVPDAVVQALEDPREDILRCRLFHRFEEPLAAGPGVIEYRCIRLGTTQSMLRLRLVDERNRPIGVRRVTVRAAEPGDGPAMDVSTDADGFSRELGPYRNLALVRVMGQGETQLTGQIPVEILSNRTVLLRVGVDARGERAGQLEADRRHLETRIEETLLGVDRLIGELNQVRATGKERDAIVQKARFGLKLLQSDLPSFQEEAARLASLADVPLESVRRKLAVLQAKQAEFVAYLDNLDKVHREEADPKWARLKEKALQARGLENEAQFDQAIALYQEVIKEASGQSGIQEYVKHVEQLKKDWALKDADAHPKARKFIYEVWPHLETANQLKSNADSARQALATMQKVGDRLTPRMLLRANISHANRLAKRLQELLVSRSEDDSLEAQAILDVQKDLDKLTKDAADLSRVNGADKP